MSLNSEISEWMSRAEGNPMYEFNLVVRQCEAIVL